MAETSSSVRVIRRRPESAPVYLLDVVAERGGRTRVHGALWEGLLNAAPEDVTDGPSPVEALLAGVAGCLVRNLRWVADGSHVTFDRLALHCAAERDDDPPAISRVHVDVELETEAAGPRVAAILERALRTGTITRTVARAARLTMTLRVNGESLPVDLERVGLGSGRG
jgi:uncharacterized OsmC-like protein